jgi:hypothetical protein
MEIIKSIIGILFLPIAIILILFLSIIRLLDK